MSDETDRVRTKIAEAMGWRRFESVGELRYGEGKDYCHVDQLPNYFEDANDAFSIVEWMKVKGFDCFLRLQNGVWKCEFTEPSREYCGGYHCDPRYAIIYSFLSFLDSEKGDGR